MLKESPPGKYLRRLIIIYNLFPYDDSNVIELWTSMFYTKSKLSPPRSAFNHTREQIEVLSSVDVWDEITYPFLNFNGATVEV